MTLFALLRSMAYPHLGTFTRYTASSNDTYRARAKRRRACLSPAPDLHPPSLPLSLPRIYQRLRLAQTQPYLPHPNPSQFQHPWKTQKRATSPHVYQPYSLTRAGHCWGPRFCLLQTVETLHYVSLGSDPPRRRVTESGILSRRMESLCTPPVFAFFVSFLLNLCDSSCASSKHLQTRRFLDTLQAYFLDVQKLLIQLHRSANQRPAPFVDHLGILRDSKTGRPINGALSSGEESEEGGENEVALRKLLSYLLALKTY